MAVALLARWTTFALTVIFLRAGEVERAPRHHGALTPPYPSWLHASDVPFCQKAAD